uniref:Secreted protein n=1 Tax=Bursaphelenchus xylophilus TaxID=6326 RepID=A0A1I7S600_BURXY
MSGCSTVVTLLLMVFGSWGKPVPADDSSAEAGVKVNHRRLNATVYSKFFEASLLLYAPDSWVTAYQAIPEDEVECLLKLTHDPSKFKALRNTADIELVKKLVANGCPDGAQAIGKFFDAASASIQALPEGLVEALEAFADSAKQFQDTVKEAHQAGSPISNKTVDDFKNAFTTFLTQFSDLSDADKQKTADTFPKLKAFVVGDNAKQLGTDILGLISKIGDDFKEAAQNPEVQTALQQLQSTFKTVVQEYLADNQKYVDEASTLIGHNITSVLKDGNIGKFGQHHGSSVTVDPVPVVKECKSDSLSPEFCKNCQVRFFGFKGGHQNAEKVWHSWDSRL